MEKPPNSTAATQEAFARSIAFDHLPDAIIVTNLDGLILDWNPAAARMFGYTRRSIIGRTTACLQPPADSPRLLDTIRQVVSKGKEWAGEIVFIRKDGSLRLCRTTTTRLMDSVGNVVGTLITNHDLSAQRAQINAVEQKRLLQTLIDAVPDLIFIKDTEGRFTLVNAAHQDLCYLPKEEVVGKTDFELPGMHKHAELYYSDDLSVVCTGNPIINREEPYSRADGTAGWFLTSKFPLRGDTGPIIGLVGISRDITERKHAEKALADEQQKLRIILDAIEDPVFVKDLEGSHVLFNAANLRVFGWTEEEAGKSVFELAIPPEIAERYAEDDRYVLSTGKPILNREEPFTLRDGATGTLLTSKFPLRDNEGCITGLVGISRDITELRKAEGERMQFERKHQEAQKLESLGVLAGGIAHDFNNLLGVILGYTGLAEAEGNPNEQVRKYLREIETAATRAGDLCKQMLAYSGRGSTDAAPVNINAVITDAAPLLNVSVGKNVQIETHLGNRLPLVIGDAGQIRQALVNLVTNASEAIGPAPGTVVISTSLLRANPAYFSSMRLGQNMARGDYVSVVVRDNGPGMPQEVLARIFDPFFTTKFAGRGLGLAAVHGIVRGHGGALNVNSMPNKGAMFQMIFPAAINITPAEPEAPQEELAKWRGSGRVLVVDDEEQMRCATGRILEAIGFETLLVPSGAEAIREFSAAPEAFSLIVLDLTMPDMSGVEVFYEIRRLSTRTPVLLISGFSELEVNSRFLESAPPSFLQKPFTLDAFRSRIHALSSHTSASQDSVEKPTA